MFSYYGSVSAEIGRLARKLQFKPIFHPGLKVRQSLHPVKDSLGLHVLGIYKVPCMCEKINIGQSVSE